jgi:surfeit locus 1 family protein
MRFTFHFRLLPFIAALAVAALGLALGQWQLRRAAEKQAIEARMLAREAEPAIDLRDGADPDALEFRHVRVRGEFLPGWTLYLDNRPHGGIAGFHVLTPLKIAGSDRHIMVARGWIARDPADRTRIPPIATPRGNTEITGIVRRNAGHLLQLGQAPPLRPGAIVQNVDPGDVARASGLALEPVVIEQTGDSGDGLVRDWPKPSLGMEKHQGYAFQWFALAATAILFFVITGFKRGSKRAIK